MSKKLWLWVATVFMTASTFCGQNHMNGYRQTSTHPKPLKGSWDAEWIGVPGCNLNEPTVCHFHKTLPALEQLPDCFTMHLSADKHCKLIVNDPSVSPGPRQGYINTWNSEALHFKPC